MQLLRVGYTLFNHNRCTFEIWKISSWKSCVIQKNLCKIYSLPYCIYWKFCIPWKLKDISMFEYCAPIHLYLINWTFFKISSHNIIVLVFEASLTSVNKLIVFFSFYYPFLNTVFAITFVAQHFIVLGNLKLLLIVLFCTNTPIVHNSTF